MSIIGNRLRAAHRIVWQYRAELEHVWPTPTPRNALRFAFTEAAEAMDAELRLEGGYARNNDKDLSVEDELADCAMMLLTMVGPDAQFADNLSPDRRDVHLDRLAYLIGLELRRDRHLSRIVSYPVQCALDIIAVWPGMNLPARITARLKRIKAKRLGEA